MNFARVLKIFPGGHEYLSGALKIFAGVLKIFASIFAGVLKIFQNKLKRHDTLKRHSWLVINRIPYAGANIIIFLFKNNSFCAAGGYGTG